MRVLAHFADDDTLKEYFRNKSDIHTEIAAKVCEKEQSQVYVWMWLSSLTSCLGDEKGTFKYQEDRLRNHLRNRTESSGQNAEIRRRECAENQTRVSKQIPKD